MTSPLRAAATALVALYRELRGPSVKCYECGTPVARTGALHEGLGWFCTEACAEAHLYNATW